ncbi:MAG TPA: hypothetical protein VNZ57_02070, partial [Longimicrobiales bacterium]|nr:hypothetical protein [Longimicrobiales bacterium]
TLAARVAARNDLLEHGTIVVGQDGIWSLLEYLNQTVPQPLEVYLPGGDEEGTWCRIRLAPVRHPPDPCSAEAAHVLA